MTKFHVGDKVVPINKTFSPKLYGGLSKSNMWKIAQEKDQNFLYVVRTCADGSYVCSDTQESTGDYFNESDLIPYVRTTKNQRITALEEKVKYLESVVDSLTHKKWTEDDLNEIEAQTLTNNQKRAAIIEKAKKFVETYSKVGKSDYNGNGEGNDFYRTWYFVVEFFIKENKVTCVATRTNEKGHRVTVDKHTSVGRAKCAPSDVFNEHIGKAIALGRALGLDVSEFEQAVQPDEVVVGMEALVKGMISDYTTTVCKSDEGLKKNENSLGFIKSNPWFFKRITNDTDAVY